MKARLSPLSILDFGITSLDFKTIPSENPGDDPQAFFPKYDIDIDFGINPGKYINVYITAKVNAGEEKLPGYSLCAQAACFFKFDEESDLSKPQIAAMEGFSTVYIALNSLRGLISNFTANAPFGRYILPSIDLNDLIAKKRALISTNSKNKSNELTIKKKIKKTARKSHK
jgi:preprotein translocase subunit SecB